MYTILVVDDEKDIVSALEIYLKAEGYRVLSAYNGREALSVAAREDVHLILMDIMMPVMDGLTAMAQLRQTSNVPVILLTAKGEDTDKVLGLNVGADDYITKPFSIREVIARVKSVLRRSTGGGKDKSEDCVCFQGLELNLQRKTCHVDGKEIKLTKTEFEMLSLFLRNRETIFSRADILSQVWSDDVIVLDRTIDVNITRLRKKIEPYGRHIVTRQGYGYGFEE